MRATPHHITVPAPVPVPVPVKATTTATTARAVRAEDDSAAKFEYGAALMPAPTSIAATDLPQPRPSAAAADASAAEVELCREYRFEAAHQLPKVPAGHRCARLHGHSYKLEIFITGPTDAESGWLIDFYDLDRAVQPVVDALDHRLLNEIAGLDNPTCERLCSWLWQRLVPELPQLSAITVWETFDSRCTYRGPRRPASEAERGR